MSPFNQSGYNFSNYFFRFCVPEEFYILLHRIRYFFNFFVKLLIVCNAYLDGFDFLLLILVILSVLQLIIGVICQRKYELLNNLK